MKIVQNWYFLGICLLLAVLVEVCLFTNQVGISYSVFIALFYVVFFLRFRKVPFQQKQISGLLFFSIAVLTISFFVYSNPYFNQLNSLVIPVLVFVHTVLVTSPTIVRWYSNSFLALLIKKVEQMFNFGKLMTKISRRKVRRKVNKSTYQTAKKIGLGILFSMPLLFIIITLLSAADEKFADLLFVLPELMLSFQTDLLWTLFKIAIFTGGFYSYFKIISKKTKIKEVVPKDLKRNWDTIIVTTILLFVNLVFLLFTVVQFQYLFSGTLQAGFSYAEYARRGFFELILVTIINFFTLIGTLTYVKNQQSKTIKVLLTFLILFSSVLLSSAFLRLMMYEQAYGITTLRVLAHSFMIFLFVIFSFTLVKVWVNRLPLVRFYLIAAVIYYVGLNMVGIDQLIVSTNIARYEATNKIDIDYLGGLSYSTIPPLVELYQENPDIFGLKTMLDKKREQIMEQDSSWQSYNLSREKAKKALLNIQ